MRGMDALGFDRRKLGAGLLAFGLTGVLLAGVIAAGLIGGAVAARNLDERLVADQQRIAAALTRLTVSMESLAMTTENAGATLTTSAEAVAEAQLVLQDTASAAGALASALDISILGSKPFAGASERIGALALRIAAFDEQAGSLAQNLDTNAGDVTAMTAQVRELKSQVQELATAVADFDRIDQLVDLIIGGIALGGLLVAWVAVGAAMCAWVGWRLRRVEGTAGSPAA
jgi:methyl-accepting chemotaxis protein